MRRKSLIALLLILICVQFKVNAQQGPYSLTYFERDDQNVYVGMQLRMTSFNIGSTETLVLIPMLQYGTSALELPKVVLNGRDQPGLFNNDPDKPYVILNMNGRHDVNYQTSTPYQPWMNNAQLRIVKSLYDASGTQLYALPEGVTSFLSVRSSAQSQSQPQPQVQVQQQVQVQPQIQQQQQVQPQQQVQSQSYGQQAPVTAADQFGHTAPSYSNVPTVSQSYSQSAAQSYNKPAPAAVSSNSNVVFNSNGFGRDGETVYVNIPLKMTAFTVQPTEVLTLTPIIQYSNTALELPKVVLTGMSRVYNNNDGETYTVQSAFSKQDIVYQNTTPYQSWMDNAQLRVIKTLYDASDTPLYSLADVVSNFLQNSTPNNQQAQQLTPATAAVQFGHAPATLQSNTNTVSAGAVFNPQIASGSYATPSGQETSLGGSFIAKTFTLYFPNKKSYQVTDMPGNASVVEQIRSAVDGIVRDGNLSLVSINIKSGTSPEGTYYDNEQLTRKRALEFQSYLKNRLGLGSVNMNVDWISEDWTGLVELINQSNMDYKYEVLNIINNVDIFKGRERDLMLLDKSRPYRYMKSNMFDQLCKIECSVIYKAK